MPIRAIKYLSPLVMFVLAWFAFQGTGWICFAPLLYAYVFIPTLELFIQPDPKNMSAAEEEVAKKDAVYDWILYAVVPLQYAALLLFLFSFQQEGLQWIDITGRIFSMGLLCGAFGINVAHELGHRVNKVEQTMAKLLLLTSQYMHFIIEHNKGHHKRVATHDDPSSARLGESLFAFYPRTIGMSYLSAWHIENNDLRKAGKSVISIYNEMIWFAIIQMAFIALIAWFFGITIMLYYLAAAMLGIGLLETVNYIEHYGLRRKEIEPGKFERAMPEHSWNSNHLIGRLMLFELSRHSDHHYLASRKYQILRHHENAPQMPTGYPGMMILAHFPPLFFYIMEKQMKKYGIVVQ
jgi:alkane 1-monooxygenase